MLLGYTDAPYLPNHACYISEALVNILFNIALKCIAVSCTPKFVELCGLLCNSIVHCQRASSHSTSQHIASRCNMSFAACVAIYRIAPHCITIYKIDAGHELSASHYHHIHARRGKSHCMPPYHNAWHHLVLHRNARPRAAAHGMA